MFTFAYGSLCLQNSKYVTSIPHIVCWAPRRWSTFNGPGLPVFYLLSVIPGLNLININKGHTQVGTLNINNLSLINQHQIIINQLYLQSQKYSRGSPLLSDPQLNYLRYARLWAAFVHMSSMFLNLLQSPCLNDTFPASSLFVSISCQWKTEMVKVSKVNARDYSRCLYIRLTENVTARTNLRPGNGLAFLCSRQNFAYHKKCTEKKKSLHNQYMMPSVARKT